LSEAAKETERLVLTKKLSHPDNPCLNWQISNAATKTDDRDNVWLDKRRSSSRIDAAVAAVMAINAFKFGKGKEDSAPVEYVRFLSLQ
jgi:phage terminase large subunit-like protein